MALFNRKKKDTALPATSTEVREKKETAAAIATPVVSSADITTHVLRNPRVTEKGTMHAEQSVYLFDVAPNATKHAIAQAVFALYKVKPRMVHVVTVPSKRKRNSRTGRSGVKQGGKKAYVYLKKGETITTT